MIKILIVDDNQKRSQMIVDAINSLSFKSFISLKVCDSADSARLELVESCDLMILDVLLPKKADSTPQSINSINLLRDVYNPSKKYLKPNLIICLTAEIQDLERYKNEFIDNFVVVLDGSLNKTDWLNKIIYSIEGLLGHEQKLISRNVDKLLITVHGIRTYGKWQRSLSESIRAYSREFEFIEMKYGFFDLISFAIPYLRNRRADKTADRILEILESNLERNIYIVAHSYGTYILAKALLKFPHKGAIKKIILCGSPLRHDEDIDKIIEKAEITINECGTADYILVLARLFILGLGDAGRVGFSRENGRDFINRYHTGGHSLYFVESGHPTFYEKYWVPMLSTDAEPEYCDSRANFLGEGVVDLTIKIITSLKPLLYFAPVGIAGYIYIIKKII